MEYDTIVIVGGGLIGQQWALIFSSSKFKVIIYEISPQRKDEATEKIKATLKKYLDEDICRSKESGESQLERIKFTSIMEELPKNAEFIMECVPEDLSLKTAVFAMLDSYFSEESIRMSSSSYIPISMFTEQLKHRRKCIIAHPVCPPYFLRVVEVVPAVFTERSTTDKVMALMALIGQTPIELKKEVEGFALNRIQAAVYNSIFNLIKNGILAVKDVDKILTEGLAPRWTFFGPMLVSVLNGPGVNNYFTKYLPSVDKVNIDQEYPPQHDDRIIAAIVHEMEGYDDEALAMVSESRDLFLGQVLKMKMQSEGTQR